MQFTIYKSTDGSAPVLTGQVGKLRDLLKACLVDGYGSKAAAGWANTYTGTNKGVFRAASGARLYYRIQDDTPVTAKEARLTGYETMSDVDTGTGPFPSAAVGGVGGVAMVPVRKSNTADATARPWIIAADARTVYGFVQTGDGANIYQSFAFGEFYSLVSSDAYNGFVNGRLVENNSATNQERLDYLDSFVTTNSASMNVPRGHSGTGACVILGRSGDTSAGAGSAALNGSIPYTNPADGSLLLAPIWCHDITTAPANGQRGRMRGFWHFCHAIASVADGDTVSGTGTLAGKTFLFIKTSGGSAGSAGVYAIETSATLETN